MKKLFAVILPLLALVLVSCYAQPKLEIQGGDTYDWKTVQPKDGPLKAKIYILNKGNDSLIILEVKPGCGCTTAPIEKMRIAPGDSTYMDVTLNITGASSSIVKTIRINSNDPQNVQKYVYLKATVMHPLALSPSSYFTFNEVQIGSEATASIKLKNNTGNPVTLSNFELTPPNIILNVSGTKTLKPGEEIEFTAKYKPTSAANYNVTLKFKTTHPDYADFVIYGYGRANESPIFNDQQKPNSDQKTDQKPPSDAKPGFINDPKTKKK